MTDFIKTSRLRLRRLTLADGPLLQELDSDPAVMRWLNGGLPTPAAVIEDKILPAMMAYAAEQPGLGAWVAIKQKSETFVGWISLRLLHADPTTAELGYRLKQTAWGQGLAAEGAQAIIDLAFVAGQINRIMATTYEENAASQRVMEKLGMTLVRRFRYQPGAPDKSSAELWPGEDVEYEITRDAWIKAQEKKGTSMSNNE